MEIYVDEFMNWVLKLVQHPWFHSVILIILIIFFGIFFICFICQFFRVSFQLKKFHKKITDIKNDVREDILKDILPDKNPIVHAWREYFHTLHSQRAEEYNDDINPSKIYRATAPAEAFFRSDTLVDTRLSVDFFKHLPGIFTGIGIIGTFSGLVGGLKKFKISDNAEFIRVSLDGLLREVGSAFLISLIAIFCAMLVTFFEKLSLKVLYAKVEKIAGEVDEIFRSGVGEEYLSELVKASKDSATNTAHLKDALVRDLKQMLEELTARQITAQKEGTQALGDSIANSFKENFTPHLEAIAQSSKEIRSDQGSAVHNLIQDTLTAFSQNLKELFGGQITGINQLQQQTSDKLEFAVGKLGQLIEGIEAANVRGSTAMSDKMGEALLAAENRQNQMNEQMARFVEQIKLSLNQSQQDTQQQLHTALNLLSEKIAALIESLTQKIQAADQGMETRQVALGEQSKQVVDGLQSQLQEVTAHVSQVVKEMKHSVEAMRAITSDAITRMNQGASTLETAADNFARAGDGVGGVLDKSTQFVGQLNQAAGNVKVSSDHLSSVLSQHHDLRESIQESLQSLQLIVAQVQKEAGLSGECMRNIESASNKLIEAQKEADIYLDKISQTLAEAFTRFQSNTIQTVDNNNSKFQTTLNESVNHLKGGIDELSDLLANINPKN